MASRDDGGDVVVPRERDDGAGSRYLCPDQEVKDWLELCVP